MAQRIYVAGSSAQLERARAAMDALKERGYLVAHDWVTEVEKVGSANPPDAPMAKQAAWAREDLQGVLFADYLWLLMPAEEGWGAAVELGYALANSVPVIISGLHNRSIFSSLAAERFDRDDQALDACFPVLQ